MYTIVVPRCEYNISWKQWDLNLTHCFVTAICIAANFGYYSLLSAAMGCRVIAWEPVPLFSAFFKYGLLLNGFTNKVEVRELVVSDQHHDVATMVVPSTGIWGEWSACNCRAVCFLVPFSNCKAKAVY
jgi:hypothetical protein